jgi:hypothetical protein
MIHFFVPERKLLGIKSTRLGVLWVWLDILYAYSRVYLHFAFILISEQCVPCPSFGSFLNLEYREEPS